jgi:hypothetical protein
MPISKYEPVNQDERDIISMLIQYQEAKNNQDIERLLPLLHDNGEFALQCGRMVTKSVLKIELPAFWYDIHSGNATNFPIVHECINGELYKTGTLNNPKIHINNGISKTTVLFTKGVCRVSFYVSMILENDRWWITRTEWGDG